MSSCGRVGRLTPGALQLDLFPCRTMECWESSNRYMKSHTDVKGVYLLTCVNTTCVFACQSIYMYEVFDVADVLHGDRVHYQYGCKITH